MYLGMKSLQRDHALLPLSISAREAAAWLRASSPRPSIEPTNSLGRVDVSVRKDVALGSL
jgi:hypothetical protein